MLVSALLVQKFLLDLNKVSNYLEIFALAGIGMSVKFKDLVKAGLKSGIYCLSIGVAQIIFAIVLISILL